MSNTEINPEIVKGFTKLGITLSGDKIKQKTECPRCEKENALSINLETGSYKCHSVKCSFQGFATTNRTHASRTMVRSYKMPDTAGIVPITAAAERFLTERGLTKEVAEKMNVRSKIDKYGNEWIAFLLYKPSAAKPSYIKYRKLSEKKFFASADAEKIFYNLESAVDHEGNKGVIYIVEGEFDALAVAQAGIKGVISVPSGASDNNMEWLETAKPLLDNYDKVVLALDNDESGEHMRDEIARRLSKARCRWVDFGEYKDANEVLLSAGAGALLDALEDHKEFDIAGIYSEKDIWKMYEDLMRDGLHPGYATGTEFDEALRILPGMLTVVTGVPSSGKSNFVDWWSWRLAEVNDWKTGFWSPEHTTPLHVDRMVKLYLGKSGPYSDSERKKAKEFILDHYYWMHTTGETDSDIDSILARAESMIYTKGIRQLVLDPFNMIDIEQGGNMSDAIGKLLKKLTTFAAKYEIHLILVAHPAKMHKTENGTYAVPDLYSVSGSANFRNMAHFGITVHRNFTDKTVEVHVTKSKYTHLGAIGNMIEFSYDVPSGRYVKVVDQTQQVQTWEKSAQQQMPQNYFSKMVEPSGDDIMPF